MAEVSRHRLLEHHRQAPTQGAHAEIGRRAVVSEHEHGVEIAPLQQRLEGLVDGDATVSAAQPLSQPWLRIGGGHEPAEVAGASAARLLLWYPSTPGGVPGCPIACSR